MEFIENIKTFYAKCRRVWLVLKKPSKAEYTTIAKVSAIGIAIVGVIGFIISIIMKTFI